MNLTQCMFNQKVTIKAIEGYYNGVAVDGFTMVDVPCRIREKIDIIKLDSGEELKYEANIQFINNGFQKVKAGDLVIFGIKTYEVIYLIDSIDAKGKIVKTRGFLRWQK